MTYYKKIAHDKAREEHLEDMRTLQFKMSMFYYDSDTYAYLQKRLLLMEKQLKLYDKIMGYTKEL